MTSKEREDIKRLALIASDTVMKVMLRNVDKKRRWLLQSSSDHAYHAWNHLDRLPLEKEDAENALCRVSMALALLEGEKDAEERV